MYDRNVYNATAVSMSAHLCVSLSCMYNYIDETNTDSSTRSEIATITTRTQTHKQCHCHSTITAMLNNPACLRLYTFATMVTSFDLHCAVSSHCDPGERERGRETAVVVAQTRLGG